MPTKRTYMVYYAVAILIWGSESVLTKAFLLDLLAPQAMLVLRTAITALVLLPLVLLDRPKLGGLSRRDWGAVLVLGVFGTALPMMLYFAALDRIPASTTMLLYRTEPIFVILLSVVVLHQRVATASLGADAAGRCLFLSHRSGPPGAAATSVRRRTRRLAGGGCHSSLCGSHACGQGIAG